MKIIKLGLINKKLLLPILLAVILQISNMLNKYLPFNDFYSSIGEPSSSLGQSLIKLIPYILRIKKNDSSFSKDKFKNYFFLFLSVLFLFGTDILLKDLKIGIDMKVVGILYLKDILDLILLLVLSIVILKYRYYIHNVISLVLFSIFGIIIDIILESFQKLNGIDVLYFLDGVSKSLLFTYCKYLMDVKFIKYWDIEFCIGLFSFIFVLIKFIIRIIIAQSDDESSENFFADIEFKYIILSLFLNLITGFLVNLLTILIINVLSPNHIAITNDIMKIFMIIFDNIQSNDNNRENEDQKKDDKKNENMGDDKKDNDNTDSYNYFFLIPFVFQLLSLLFYLEILEYNFCKLNVNTKKNILLREEEGRLTKKKSYQSDIDVGSGMFIKEMEDKASDLIESDNKEYYTYN